jgi:hypothetical protein
MSLRNFASSVTCSMTEVANTASNDERLQVGLVTYVARS